MVGPWWADAIGPPGPTGETLARASAPPRRGPGAAHSSRRRSRPARRGKRRRQRSQRPGIVRTRRREDIQGARAARRVASWLLGRSSPVNWVSWKRASFRALELRETRPVRFSSALPRPAAASTSSNGVQRPRRFRSAAARPRPRSFLVSGSSVISFGSAQLVTRPGGPWLRATRPCRLDCASMARASSWPRSRLSTIWYSRRQPRTAMRPPRQKTATIHEARGQRRRRAHLPRAPRTASAGPGSARRRYRVRSSASSWAESYRRAAPCAGTSGRSSPGRGHARHQPRRRDRVVVDDLADRLHRGLALERRPAGEHLVEDRARARRRRRPGRRSGCAPGPARGPCSWACP